MTPSNGQIEASTMTWRLEVVVMAVADVHRAKARSADTLGFAVAVDGWAAQQISARD